MSNTVRRQQIEERITKAYTLIGELEQKMLVTQEPLDKARWLSQIEEQKKNIANWEAELDRLQQPKPQISQSAGTAISLAELQQKMAEQFNLKELRDLCFDLGVDHEEMSSEVKKEFCRELIGYLKRRGRLAELISRVQELRPEL